MTESRASVERVVARALRDTPRVVLAVSGGVDSMVLLDVATRVARARVAAVATFDHGTGAAAREGVELVARKARALGVHVERGAAQLPRATEAEWRAARWAFLHAVAGRHDASVATAHTRDDHLETILIRVLRGSGARGLAALAVPAPGIVRPLVEVSRAAILRYARMHRLEWVEDPTNLSRAYLRNRVRVDLLPALLAVRPALGDELLGLAERAASLRRELDALVAKTVVARIEDGELVVARDSLASYDPSGLSVLWPALAGRLGVALDRRGTMRVATFTKDARSGQRIQLSGGYEVVSHRGELRLRREAVQDVEVARPLRDGLVVGAFRFRFEVPAGPEDVWNATLPTDRPVAARPWHPGDRMTPAGAAGARRVKRLFREAGIDAAARRGWPVVLAGDEIVWVPGVRRGVAATARSGRPVQRVACERIVGR